MSENRGIFSLEEFYDLQVSGETTNIFEVFRYVNSLEVPATGGPAYAYVAGGYPSAQLSKVQRIDFNNDTATASPKGDISSNRAFGAGVGDRSYGYAGGGSPDGTKIDRVDYENDTATASPKGNLSQSRIYLSAAGNTSYGWWAGGAGGEYSTIDRKDYANDTTTNSVRGTLTVGKRVYSSGTGNLSYGYFCGGATGNGGPYISTVERVEYSNDASTASPKGPLTSAQGYSAAGGNGDFGYIGGGSPASSPNRSTIDRIDFSNDTASTLARSSLAPGYNGYFAAAGNSNFGYWMGGISGSKTKVDRLDYSNDTATTSPKGPLSAAKYTFAGGFSGQDEGLSTSAVPIVPATRSETYPAGGPNYGYIASGDPSSEGGTNIYRIDFDADTTTAAPKGKLNVVRRSNSEGSVGNGSYGYFCGGFQPSHLSSIDRMDYGNDTATATPKGNLANPGNNWAAAGNTNYGWIAAGQSPSTNYMTSINRIDYSSDTGTTVRGNTDNYHRIGTAGNLDYGYWAGGGSPKTSRTVRLDYSNDTVWGTTKGPLNASKYNVEGAGNANYGYFAGGSTGVPSTDPSVVDRLDYSNDTATASPRGNLSGKMSDDAATANGSYGYFAPGPSGQPNKRSIDRVDFSNDTATASPRGNIINDADGRMGISPLENGLPSPTTKTVDKGADGYITTTTTLGPAYGYWSGGTSSSPSGVTTIDRVDFNNDTATASPKGNLIATRYKHTAVSSLNHAYMALGSPYPYTTNIGRLDYADDTATVLNKGTVITGLVDPAGVGTKDYGYFCGGLPVSTVQRIDYTNDTATAIAKGPLSAARRYIAGVGNRSYGYITGGTPPNYSTVDRIDYGNDTATAAVKGSLPYVLQNMGATGNADYGYVTGGFNTVPGSNNWLTTIQRIDYSNDTPTTSPKGNLSSPRTTRSTGNTSYGWSGGGSTSGHAATSTVDRIDFASDTATAAPKGPLSIVHKSHAAASGQQDNMGSSSSSFIPRIRWVDSAAETPAVSGGPAYGYVAHGLGSPAAPSPPVSTTYRIDFSNDTATTTTTGNQTTSAYYTKGVGNGSYGYILSGAEANNTNVSRIDYGNDSAACAPKGPLAYGAWEAGATGNESYGYHGGGYIPSNGARTSKVQRLDYSSDTSTAVEKGPLYATHYRTAATGNLSYGYWGGGDNPGISSLISRVDYTSDTSTASPKGPLDFVCKEMAAVGNQTHGYWGGGLFPAISKVQRLEWANDTTTASPKGNLSVATKLHTATGSDSYGYFAGGLAPWPTSITTIDRIDYSNDTATATPKGNLTAARYGQASVSAQENALQNSPTPAIAAPVQPPFPYPEQLYNPANNSSGGYGLGHGSIVQRIDYSNDTANAVSKGYLSAAIGYHSAVSSPSHAYTFGGSAPGGSYRSIIQRVDYSNDTATAPTVANLYEAVYRTYSGMGTKDYGYQSGGSRPSASTKIDRIEYASDTATGLLKGNLAGARYLQTATGNLSYGYVCGGSPPFQNNSRVQRIDYGNDTGTAVFKGPLHQGSRKLSSAGTVDYGYVAGGSDPELSSTTRIDYSSDTAVSVQKGHMSRTRRNFGGMSSPAYAYFFGGAMPWPTPALTSTDRLDFSNDTNTASPKGPLSAGMSYFSAASGADIAGALQ